MALSAFDDKSKKPRPGDLKKMLSRTSVHWDNLVSHIADKYAPLDETWNFAGAQWGWSLRLKQKKRTVLYMTPCKGYFLVGFVLGEKAVKAAHEGALDLASCSRCHSSVVLRLRHYTLGAAQLCSLPALHTSQRPGGRNARVEHSAK